MQRFKLQFIRQFHLALAMLSDSVLLGDSNELSEQGSGASALREAISNVRQGLAEQVALRGSGAEAGEPEQVVEIENLVEEIIRSRELIGQALKEGRTGDESLIETVWGRGFRLNLPPGRL